MRLLLDTHVAIWAVAYPQNLPDEIRALLDDSENEISVSVVTLWEIAIKNTLRRPSQLPFSAVVALGYFRGSGYRMLDVAAEHALAVENLPPIHGDPFDRLLVAQALAEPLRLVTHDAKVATYSDTVIHF